jgi:hypothetical protein
MAMREGMKDHTDFAELANVYLEDSFVLAIDEKPAALSFRVEVALTSGHPRYHFGLRLDVDRFLVQQRKLQGAKEALAAFRSVGAQASAAGSSKVIAMPMVRWDPPRRRLKNIIT